MIIVLYNTIMHMQIAKLVVPVSSVDCSMSVQVK